MTSDRLFSAVAAFPAWLESFDKLNIPAWLVVMSVAIAIAGFIFAIREFLSWFLKTSAIVDEVVRLKTLVQDLQGDVSDLELTVARLQATALPAQAAESTDRSPVPNETKARQFRLDS